MEEIANLQRLLHANQHRKPQDDQVSDSVWVVGQLFEFALKLLTAENRRLV